MVYLREGLARADALVAIARPPKRRHDRRRDVGADEPEAGAAAQGNPSGAVGNLRRGHIVTNTAVFFSGARILDVLSGSTHPAQSVLIREGRIAAIGDQALTAPSDVGAIDLRGMTLMPGLIDAHVHVTAATASFAELETWSPAYAAARAGELMRAMLMRGFTMVGDTGGRRFWAG